MSTIKTLISAPFGNSYSGMASSVTASCTDVNGTARSLGSPSFAEQPDGSGNATTGIYNAVALVDPSWAYPLLVQFALTGAPGVGAVQFIQGADLLQPGQFGSSVITVTEGGSAPLLILEG